MEKGFGPILAVGVFAALVLSLAYVLNGMAKKSRSFDISIAAVQLASQKMEEELARKANSGYDAVVREEPLIIYSGNWTFSRKVEADYVEPDSFRQISADRGYKLLRVSVAWGNGEDEVISLETLVTDQVPAEVKGPAYLRCE